jgi:hypothetical protein
VVAVASDLKMGSSAKEPRFANETVLQTSRLRGHGGAERARWSGEVGEVYFMAGSMTGKRLFSSWSRGIGAALLLFSGRSIHVGVLVGFVAHAPQG